MVASGLQLIPLSRVSMCASYWKKTDKVGMSVSRLVSEVFSDCDYLQLPKRQRSRLKIIFNLQFLTNRPIVA